jgi:16S rRNA (cytosine1402-N4)-methyltransferase
MKTQSGHFANGTRDAVPNSTRDHIPVMLEEVLACLSAQDGGVYVDGTFGAGGYTRAILNAADCKVYAIDRDPEAFARAETMAKEYPQRLFPVSGCFGDMADLLRQQGVERVDGIVLDVGVSSMQIDRAERGFSFQKDGPLDMRMSSEGQSAGDVVATASEEDLADIIFNYGGERAARRIAKKIVAARTQQPLRTTQDLVRLVHEVLPMHGGIKTDTATKTFQALRIFVNDELGELSRALEAAEKLLVPGGTLAVVSFHSLEDGCVKDFLRERSGKAANGSRHFPPLSRTQPTFLLKKTGGDKPSDAEIARNPRARSARLRCGIRAPEAPHA